MQEGRGEEGLGTRLMEEKTLATSLLLVMSMSVRRAMVTMVVPWAMMPVAMVVPGATMQEERRLHMATTIERWSVEDNVWTRPLMMWWRWWLCCIWRLALLGFGVRVGECFF